MSKTVTIDGIEYAPVSNPGNRAVVVVDRGWIFAGDVHRENGFITLSRCVWVFKWSSVGFAKVIDDPSVADIRPIASVRVPEGAEVFSISVHDDWGL